MNQEASSEINSGDAAAPAASAISPGELLRRAREALNLTISDLAGQTRLSRAVLEALENNDFASLAMPVYVRGYFRKCAHVLNVPEDRLLEAYAAWTGTSLKPQPVPVTISEPPREYAPPRRSPSWRYVLVLAVVAGAVLWWFASGDGLPERKAAVDESGGVRTLNITPPAVEPLPPPSDGGSATRVEGGLPLPGDNAPAAGVPGAATPNTATTTAPAGTALGPAGPNALELRVTRTSWVEIYDSKNARLMYGLMQPGTQQRMTGTPPYQVVLGHPQGVQLMLGGRAIDLSPYTTESGTARLEVGSRR